MLTVTPKSFIFVQCKPNENADGSLNLYIQTDNSGNPQGDLTPSFQPGGTAIPSIPDGYSASLILSNNFMQNSFFTSQLNKDGWTTAPQAATQGIVYHLTKNEKIHVPGVSQMGTDQQHSDDVNINFNTTPFVFSLDERGVAISFHFSQKVNWREAFVDVQTGDVLREHGSFNAHVDVNKHLQPTVSAEDVLNFGTNVGKGDAKVSLTDVKHSLPGFLSSSSDVEDKIKKKIPDKIGTYQFGFQGVGVFIISNLLFPGKNVFKIDTSEGIHAPKDLILFGNISADK